MTLFAKAGPVYAKDDGRLICTLTRDVMQAEAAMPEQFILPDGSHPKADEVLPYDVSGFISGELEFFQE